jgi:L-cysteate sulfo-lyase
MIGISPSIPRVRLAHLPTPLQKLGRLSAELGGPGIWIKRDDLTGLATGGNKVRKLEYLVADALEQGADTLITVGAKQSNHARQTAAAAARCGLKATLVLTGDDPGDWTGNLLLDHLLGATVRWTGDLTRQEMVDKVAAEERAAGRTPYSIRVGGSNPIGALGYVGAMFEFGQQCRELDLHPSHVLFASSSGGTQSGMVVGAKLAGVESRVLGLSVDEPEDELRRIICDLAVETATRLGHERLISPEDIFCNADYTGAGYAIMGDPEREAIRLLARTEGLIVDPVYTGRALAGLIDLVRRGAFAKDDSIVFWHTGGHAALFAYADELLSI